VLLCKELSSPLPLSFQSTLAAPKSLPKLEEPAADSHNDESGDAAMSDPQKQQQQQQQQQQQGEEEDEDELLTKRRRRLEKAAMVFAIAAAGCRSEGSIQNVLCKVVRCLELWDGSDVDIESLRDRLKPVLESAGSGFENGTAAPETTADHSSSVGNSSDRRTSGCVTSSSQKRDTIADILSTSTTGSLPNEGSSTQQQRKTFQPPERRTMGMRLDLSEKEQRKWALDQLECGLCLGLLFEPTTMPCGHTVCRPCLARTLDHALMTTPSCPICRADLVSYLEWIAMQSVTASKERRGFAKSHVGSHIPVNKTLDAILKREFATELEERKQQLARSEAPGGSLSAAKDDPHAAVEAEDGTSVIPIFICSVALPGVETRLHVFEPRYRLMMRRCLDSPDPVFGMSLGRSDYGTLLRITDFVQTRDGRSAITSTGVCRFHVLEWGEKDGYATGKVEWLHDDADEEEADDDAEATTAPSPEVTRLAEAIRDRLARFLDRIEEQLGPCPSTDGSDGRSCPGFVFWCLSVAQALSICSPMEVEEICYGDGSRSDPGERLKRTCQIFQRCRILGS